LQPEQLMLQRIFIFYNAMKLSSILKEFAILFYFVIFLQGSMVSLPMFVYLLFTVADFGTTEQIFAAIALFGLIIHFLHLSFKSKTKKVIVDIFVFACLLSPLIQRMLAVPFARFNYSWFLIPAVGFVSLYLATLVIRIIHAVRPIPQEKEIIAE
jgi:hypothetical protein